MFRVSEAIEYTKVGKLKPSFRDLTLIVKLVNLGVQRVVSSRRSQSEHLITDALVGDETGSVVLTLWDDQINKMQVGDVFKITNAYTSLYKGSLRLNIGRYGNTEKVDEEIEVNTKNNLSDVRHERTMWYRPTGRPFRRRRRR